MEKGEAPKTVFRQKLPPISTLTFVLDHKRSVVPPSFEQVRVEGIIAMCSLPGKVEKAAQPVTDKDKLNREVERLQTNGIRKVVCLVNKYEMRCFGVEKDKYELVCKKFSIEPIFYEIVEMSPPAKPPKEFDRDLIEPLSQMVASGDSIAVHCRAGVGRAGLVVCCVMLRLRLFRQAEDAIKYLRGIRHHNCVESHNQRKYVKQFQVYLDAVLDDIDGDTTLKKSNKPTIKSSK